MDDKTNANMIYSNLQSKEQIVKSGFNEEDLQEQAGKGNITTADTLMDLLRSDLNQLQPSNK